MSTISRQKAGRKYSVDSSGITSLKKDFVVIQDAVMAANGETLTFPGVPAIGTAHPSFPGLYVQTYDVAEGDGADKKTLVVTVNYGPRTSETSGEGSSAVTAIVTEWGWDDGTDEIELTAGQDGTPVRNSVGDPYDSVPTIMTPSPVFTKVMRFRERQTGWHTYRSRVNQSSFKLGGVTYMAATMLCSVSEKRLIGVSDYKYEYTVRLRYKTHLVKLTGSSTLTEIGWDVAITDAGMREWDLTAAGKKVLISVTDKETGKPCTVTSPALLDGHGMQLAEGQEQYNFRVQAYPRATFPTWFYSEPTAQEEGL